MRLVALYETTFFVGAGDGSLTATARASLVVAFMHPRVTGCWAPSYLITVYQILCSLTLCTNGWWWQWPKRRRGRLGIKGRIWRWAEGCGGGGLGCLVDGLAGKD